VNAKLIEELLSFVKENGEIYVKSSGYTCSRDIDREVALFSSEEMEKSTLKVH
jgi:hypothetical protein